MSEGTVFVVDDDDGVRNSLKLLFTSVNIMAEFYDSAESFLASQSVSSPGCVILDLRMPGMGGLLLQKTMLKKNICMPIIVVTAHADVTTAIEAMKNGAFDFLEKPYSDQVLLERIQLALKKDAQDCYERRCIENVKKKLDLLTRREQQVAEYVIQGKQNKEIAGIMGLSIKTIETHRANLMKKLEARSATDLLKIYSNLNTSSR